MDPFWRIRYRVFQRTLASATGLKSMVPSAVIISKMITPDNS